MGGLEEKLNENCPAVKVTLNNLTSEVEMKNTGTPAKSPIHPILTPGETAGQQSCFVFNLA